MVADACPARRERELKMGVRDEAIFDALLVAAGGQRDAPCIQQNHFFDSADGSFSRRGLALRIRREDDGWTVTLKGPKRSDSGPLLADRPELECALEAASATEVLSSQRPARELLAFLSRAHGTSALLTAALAASEKVPLELLGGFRNVRTRVRTALAAGGETCPVTLEFDRSEFAPDDVRYEVELEFSAEDSEVGLRDAMLELFRSVGAEPLPTGSKFAYFLERRGTR